MSELLSSSDYKDFIKAIKENVRQAQIKAHLQVNEGLLRLYWDLAEGIIEMQNLKEWGSPTIYRKNVT